MSKSLLFYFIISSHIESNCIRLLLKHALADSKCTRFIIDDKLLVQDRFLVHNVHHIIISQRLFEENSYSNLSCWTTHYVLESNDPAGVLRLFPCQRGVIFSERFEPFTSIFLILFVDKNSTKAYETLKDTLLCFSELHAHFIQLYAGFPGNSTPDIVSFYRGRTDKLNSSICTQSESDTDVNIVPRFKEESWRYWKPNFTNESNVFIAGYFHYPPYVFIDKKNKDYAGLDKFIVTEVTRGWRVAYKLYPDMAFSQVVQDIITNKLHTYLCAAWHIRVSFNVSDSSIPYTETCVTFMVPKKSEPMSAFFLLSAMPYSFVVIAILEAVLTAIIVYVFDAIYRKIVLIQQDKHRSISMLVFLKYGDLLMNTNRPTPTKLGIRIVHASWLLTALLITNVYSTGISSNLTVPKKNEGIRTFKNVIEHNLIWEHDSSGSNEIFEESPDVALKKIAETSVPTGTNLPVQRIIQNVNVLYQKYVDVYIDHSLNQELSEGKLGKALLRECAGLYNYVYPLNKRSSFKMIINNKLFSMVEAGLIEFWTRMLHRTFKNTKDFNIGILRDVKDVQQQSITFTAVQGLLILLVVCYSICIMVFLVELFTYNYDLKVFVFRK